MHRSNPLVPATGAVAGTPGTFTPPGAEPPDDPSGMVGLTATPSTPWQPGEWVQTKMPGTVGAAYWNGAAWAQGIAP